MKPGTSQPWGADRSKRAPPLPAPLVAAAALAAAFLVGAWAPQEPARCGSGDAIRISLANNTPAERATAAQLERLLNPHEVRRWLFTCDVVIDETSLPRSHPVLTLHTRHRRDDDLLLSTFLHEQLHWFLVHRPIATAQAADILQREFPRLPIGFPLGSSDAAGNYVHLMIGLLEWNALKAIIGELRARAVMTFWAEDHYTAVYEAVLQRPAAIAAALRDAGLLEPRPAAVGPSSDLGHTDPAPRSAEGRLAAMEAPG